MTLSAFDTQFYNSLPSIEDANAAFVDRSNVFARLAPSPGGPFRTGTWADDPHGPRLEGAAAWAAVRLLETEPAHAGWGLLVRSVLERIDFADDVAPLRHQEGHYL